MKRKQVFLYMALIVVLGIMFSLSGCKAAKSKRTLTLTGKIETPVTAITSPRSGKVLGLILGKGDRIRKGEPLFAITREGEDAGINKATSELAKAEAQLKNAKNGGSPAQIAAAQGAASSAQLEVEQAQKSYQKMSRLYQAGGIARKKLEQSQQNLQQAEASLEATQAHLNQLNTKQSPQDVSGLEARVKELKAAYDKQLQGQTANEITAPSTCKVTEVLVKNGDQASQKQTIMNVRSLTDCTIKARAGNIPSTAALKEGLKVTIHSQQSAKTFVGIIASVNDGTAVITSTEKPEDLPDGTEVTITLEVE